MKLMSILRREGAELFPQVEIWGGGSYIAGRLPGGKLVLIVSTFPWGEYDGFAIV